MPKKAAPDYEVGYGKPPVSSRFKPGQSGNPKGRPKGSRNLATDLAGELSDTILIREGETAKKVTKQQAMIKALIAKAMKGGVRACQQIYQVLAHIAGIDSQAAVQPLSKDEEDLLDMLAKRAAQSRPTAEQ